MNQMENKKTYTVSVQHFDENKKIICTEVEVEEMDIENKYFVYGKVDGYTKADVENLLKDVIDLREADGK